MTGNVPEAVSQIAETADRVTDAFDRFQRYLKSRKRRNILLKVLNDGAPIRGQGWDFSRYLIGKLKAGGDITAQDLINNIDGMIYLREEMIMTVEVALAQQEISDANAWRAIENIKRAINALERLISQFYTIKQWAIRPAIIQVDGDINTLMMATRLALQFLSGKIHSTMYSLEGDGERIATPAAVFENEETRKILTELCKIFRLMCDKLKAMRFEFQ